MRSDITGLWKAAARGARSASRDYVMPAFAAMNAATIRRRDTLLAERFDVLRANGPEQSHVGRLTAE
jgi:hypothetical protein